MNQQVDQETHSSRRVLYLPMLFIGICLLYGCITLAIRPLYDLSQNQSIPISINATKTADYSPDFYTPVGNVSLNIILDLFRDREPASVPEDRMATLVGILKTPVASVTIPAGSTQVNPTTAGTLSIETTVAETTLTENPVVTIPATPIPSTATHPPPPPPPPKPTKPPTDEPPPPSPTATYTPTSTYTPSPEPVHLEIVVPSTDGAVISNISDTMFEAEAWDPAVGTNNGDGITSITFVIYDSLLNPIYTDVDATPFYCAFGGDSSCNDAASIVLSSGTYNLEATVFTDASETKTITRTFIVPTVTHLEIIVPPSDGMVITNMNQTKFEAEAWDTAIGINNGDGITSVEFVIYDSTSTPIYADTDGTPLYCAFGGDSSCGNAASAGVTLPAGNYTLEATVLTDASETITVTRTFTIP